MTPAPRGSDPSLGAIVLAGGTGTRLGGVDKAALELAGRPLLDRVLDAVAAAGALGTVVVGDVAAHGRPGVRVVVEDPPRSGPAAGIVAGLAALAPCEHVLVLACDLADPDAGVRALAQTARDGGLREADGLCVGDADGHPQWLFGVHRRDALDRAAAAFGMGTNRSVRGLMAPLRLRTLTGVTADDIDTWDAHARWSERLHRTPGEPAAPG